MKIGTLCKLYLFACSLRFMYERLDIKKPTMEIAGQTKHLNTKMRRTSKYIKCLGRLVSLAFNV